MPLLNKEWIFFAVIKSRYEHYPEDHSWCIVVATTDLRSKIVKDLGLADEDTWRVKTWERAHIEPLPSTVLFDDCGLIPTFDLNMLLQPGPIDVFFTGEPGQSGMELPFSVPGWSDSRTMVECVKGAACEFRRKNRRLGYGTAAKLGVQTINSRKYLPDLPALYLPMLTHADPGDYYFSFNRNPPATSTVVASTNGQVSSYEAVNRHAFTIAASQGQTFPVVELFVDSYMMKADNKAIYTALYRSSGDMFISLPHNYQKLQPASSILKGLLHAAATGDWSNFMTAVRSHKIRSCPPQLRDPLRSPGVPAPPLKDLLFKPLAGNGNIFNDMIARQLTHYMVNKPKPETMRQWIYDDTWAEGRSRRSIVDRLLYFTRLPWL